MRGDAKGFRSFKGGGDYRRLLTGKVFLMFTAARTAERSERVRPGVRRARSD